MTAHAGWYPDPGGGAGLYRYWDGRVWSAATSANPSAPPPAPVLGTASSPAPGTSMSGSASFSGPGSGGAYAGVSATPRRRSAWGWWLGAAALLVVLVVVGVFALRAIGGSAGPGSGVPGGQASQNACPPSIEETASPAPDPADGRVHGGPLSYPKLGSPWGAPQGEVRVPFGSDVQSQLVDVEPAYDGTHNWVASVLVAELQAGDGFFTPEQGSQIVVRCILGAFYGDNPVTSDVQVNRGLKIDGRDAWLVESKLSFEIEGLKTKGELLIVAIVATGATAGLYYASIPDTRPELVKPARNVLAALTVDG